ncbi:MAG: methionine--tRNA ligase [Methanobacteriota archaeon]
MTLKDRVLVTAALPYANGPVHVGHAIGAYIPADIYVRYLRANGTDVLYICGTDEHGTPITVTADAEGVTPKDVVDKYHDIQLAAFESIGVEFDNFSGTSRKIHHELSQHFFTAINDKGHIFKKTVERPFCPSCDKFLPDRYVRGTCPSCGAEDQRGDQCEACGKQLEPHELNDAYCAICGGTPKQKETTHWFFKLSEFAQPLKEWIEKDCSHWPDNARNFALGWIKEGLEDRAITRDLAWGIPVPLPEAEGKVLYVWFDAPIGYISSTKEWAEKNGKGDAWKKYWTQPTKIIHFIGKDNIPFHTIIWPATLIAEGSYTLPWRIASNEFLNLEGRKVSTSRGWVIWLHDITRKFNPDAVRYYLISIAPETSDSDFHLDEFQQKVNNELIANLGNFINRTLTFIQNKKGGVVPDPSSDKKELWDDNIRAITYNECIREDGGAVYFLEKFKFKAALSHVMSLAQAGNKYFQDKEPWKNSNDRTLYESVNLVARLAIFIYPFLPFSAEKIWNMLNLEGNVSDKKWRDGDPQIELVKPGHRIGEVETLYDKIVDEDIEEFKGKFLKLGEKKLEVVELPEIDYSEFEKTDLRVGEIKKVGDHPNADKLYVLEVDLGPLGLRTLVAGIKESYGKDELVGKKIIVVANLKPVKIRGVESKGMLLAADVEGKPIILSPEKDATAGTKVR